MIRPLCHVCGIDVIASGGLQRVNPTGEPGVWSCAKHVGRVGCEAPFCRRTRRGHYLSIWICGDHWRLVPRTMKLPYFRIWKVARKIGEWTPEMIVRHDRIMRRLSRAVVEAVLNV